MSQKVKGVKKRRTRAQRKRVFLRRQRREEQMLEQLLLEQKEEETGSLPIKKKTYYKIVDEKRVRVTLLFYGHSLLGLYKQIYGFVYVSPQAEAAFISFYGECIQLPSVREVIDFAIECGFTKLPIHPMYYPDPPKELPKPRLVKKSNKADA